MSVGYYEVALETDLPGYPGKDILSFSVPMGKYLVYAKAVAVLKPQGVSPPFVTATFSLTLTLVVFWRRS